MYPKVIMADTNLVFEFQIYCSKRHVALPSYSDQFFSIQVHFNLQRAFVIKKTAKSEFTKLAMVELGLLRLSPKG
ncbi:hypothetical protein HMI54_002841 [Coelomomyces lativittatus]|nr:hypothetical protein HMI54_002841 [Coelomomyces lativittatus]